MCSPWTKQKSLASLRWVGVRAQLHIYPHPPPRTCLARNGTAFTFTLTSPVHYVVSTVSVSNPWPTGLTADCLQFALQLPSL